MSTAATLPASPPPALRLWAPFWVLLYVALWPASRVSEAVLSLGALVALAMLIKARFRDGEQLLSPSAWALTTALFFCYWLPQLFSSLDAIDPAQSLRKTLSGLRYLPFLWLTAIAVADARGRRVVFAGLAAVMLAWSLDLLLQALGGRETSLLHGLLDGLYQQIRDKAMCDGQEARGLGRINGVFGTCNPVLGIVLASFSPFALAAAHRRWGKPGWLIAATLTGLAILLAGARAAWLTYALVLALSGWRALGGKALLALAVTGALAVAALAQFSPAVAGRLARTAAVFSTEDAGVDAALSGRERIWRGALCMVHSHPVNGVGVRGFRHAWDDCDQAARPACGNSDCPPAPAAEWGEGPALHAHQLVLEILSETGLLGLLLWLAGAALAWRAWRWASPAARDNARPAALALAVTAFPLNTHLAFYSAFWGGAFLLLLALYAGSLLARDLPSDTTTPRQAGA